MGANSSKVSVERFRDAVFGAVLLRIAPDFDPQLPFEDLAKCKGTYCLPALTQVGTDAQNYWNYYGSPGTLNTQSQADAAIERYLENHVLNDKEASSKFFNLLLETLYGSFPQDDAKSSENGPVLEPVDDSDNQSMVQTLDNVPFSDCEISEPATESIDLVVADSEYFGKGESQDEIVKVHVKQPQLIDTFHEPSIADPWAAEEAAREAEKARLAAEADAAREAEKARLAAEADAAREAEKARLAAEADAVREAEKARLAAEAEAAREAEKARLAAEEEAVREAEKARLAAEEEAAREAEKARLAVEAEVEKARQLAEEEVEKARLAEGENARNVEKTYPTDAKEVDGGRETTFQSPDSYAEDLLSMDTPEKSRNFYDYNEEELMSEMS